MSDDNQQKQERLTLAELMMVLVSLSAVILTLSVSGILIWLLWKLITW